MVTYLSWRLTDRTYLCQRIFSKVTHLCPSSVKAKSPSSRSRKRYLGGSDILLLSKSSADCWKTSSTSAFVTEVFAAIYPSFRRVWRELTIRDNTFAKLSEIFLEIFTNFYFYSQLQLSKAQIELHSKIFFSYLFRELFQNKCQTAQSARKLFPVGQNWKTFDV